MNKLKDFAIGIPCKYSEIAIIPKHIYEYFSDGEWTAVCRGGERVKLELLRDYPSDTSESDFKADLSELFHINIDIYISIWEKRVDALKLRENGWVKVRMQKVDEE